VLSPCWAYIYLKTIAFKNFRPPPDQPQILSALSFYIGWL
jgi:hypothetical protein